MTPSDIKKSLLWRSGVIGSRHRLKICCSFERAGSSPVSSTIPPYGVVVCMTSWQGFVPTIAVDDKARLLPSEKYLEEKNRVIDVKLLRGNSDDNIIRMYYIGLNPL